MVIMDKSGNIVWYPGHKIKKKTVFNFFKKKVESI